MKRTVAATVLLAGALGAGMAAWPGCDMQPAPSREASGASEPDAHGGPFAGADEATKYTILLSTYVGPAHAANAKQIKDRAVEASFAPAKELLVVHKENGSDLYWSRTYRSPEDAKPDLMTARNFHLVKDGPPVFPGAITVAKMPAEYGPAEWNLKNATWEYEFTLLVGEYEDSPKHGYVGRRIKDCVEHVRQLRKKGYKAYYYHGATKSLATVGMYLEAAAQQTVLKYQTDRNGQKIPVYGQKIVDPEIEKIMRTQDPLLFCLWNGHIQYEPGLGKDGKPTKTTICSKLISIPRSAADARKVLDQRLRASEDQRDRDIDSLKEPEQMPRNP